MIYTDTVSEVDRWARQRGLDRPSNSSNQIIKLMEEVGELSAAYNKGQQNKVMDSIGDIQIVLIILCMQLGLGYQMSLDEAYKQIKYRKGKMINGSFVKDEDLEER
ncbi:MazG-like family protein [Latilactobacillus curvatus]